MAVCRSPSRRTPCAMQWFLPRHPSSIVLSCMALIALTIYSLKSTKNFKYVITNMTLAPSGLESHSYENSTTRETPEENVSISANHSDFSHLRCKALRECLRLKSFFKSWPDTKPKAAIHFLTRPNTRTGQMRNMLMSLFEHFVNEHRYPVIIFYTGNMTKELNAILSDIPLKHLVFMQEITFPDPPVLDMVENGCPGGVGYRHMCRFHANTMYTHPMMTELEYAWRLDDDSLLLGPQMPDIFAFMKTHGLVYGYISISHAWSLCMEGLRQLATDFARKHKLKPTFLNNWPGYRVFYNNFEISSVSFWRSRMYREFVREVDINGGIFRQRWGDASVKTIGLAVLVPPDKIQQFDTIGYRHQHHRQFGKSVTPIPRLLSSTSLFHKRKNKTQ